MKTARWRALEALSARVDFLLGVHATSGGGEVETSLLFFPLFLGLGLEVLLSLSGSRSVIFFSFL
jgi:hypothetical protein